ncbi:MAG: alpha/beta hydrolase [Schwartzia sp.]|nr:alpha/beta hydrolase [Schwartzia sp. (in: firmicutes)]
MDTLVLYIHGKDGSVAEADHYRGLFPDADVVGFDYSARTPWEAETEFPAFYDATVGGYRQVVVAANSIGAFFTFCALDGKAIDRAFFISPIVDMEKLILDMMRWAQVTEEELREKREITTEFGETLSWEYLCYVRRRPVRWHVPSHILYGGKDNLTNRETVTAFADKIGATLTVMEDGEHWFHTDEQMNFLDEWVRTHSVL